MLLIKFGAFARRYSRTSNTCETSRDKARLQELMQELRQFSALGKESQRRIAGGKKVNTQKI